MKIAARSEVRKLILGALVVVTMTLGINNRPSTAASLRDSHPAPCSHPGELASVCPGGNQFTFVNDNPYPVWLGEAYQGGDDLARDTIAPPQNDWEIAPNGGSVSLCMPTPWSGRFWPRTECQFSTLFANDKGYTDCTSTSQCTEGHVCYGGKCMLDCSSGNTPFCQGASGLDNPKAVCIPGDFVNNTPQVHVCSYPSGTVCKTGDCEGLYQCYGVWDKHTAREGTGGPVSLFEPTSDSQTDVNYDVSLVSGYNTAIKVTPSPTNCYAPACVSDLNSSCPANLQVTEPPTANQGPIPCGSGTYCQTGVCENNDTRVIACNDPGDQCTGPNPPSDLECNTVVPGGDGSTYADMYLAKNNSGNVKDGNGVTMSSGNQGVPTCWADVDCPPGETCAMNKVVNFPTDAGICQDDASAAFLPFPNCMTQSDVGKPCGGYIKGTEKYPNALGYTCASAGSGQKDVACVPAYDPPTSGLGSLETSNLGNRLFSGTASLMNPEWEKAAAQAGNGTPWYKVFSAACPHQYGWQYDDKAGGLDCNTKGTTQVDMTITFGLKQ